MARLLVSVRSADEARAAILGGASIIDVKEPSAGPLGCANPAVWSEIRRVVPTSFPLSVALGELADWDPESTQFPPVAAWSGVAFAKMGLAGAPSDWLARWSRIRSRFERDFSDQCSWVAVIYADWLAAAAPNPDEILAVALDTPRCAGVLVDTWGKSPRPTVDLHDGWQERLKRIHDSGRFFAWAGGLDIAEIERLSDSGLKPDIIAVRGSACRNGNRLGTIDIDCVARLNEAAARV